MKNLLLVISMSVFSSFLSFEIQSKPNNETMFGGLTEDNQTNNDSNKNENNRLVDTYIQNRSFFDNMYNNFGNNHDTNATCGFVAMAMLLNYYDTYLNDDIVPENFEVIGNFSDNSPGTVFEANSGLPYDSVADYYNYLRDNYINTSLHAYLILLKRNALTSNPNSLESTYLDEFGTNTQDLYDLACTYLNLRNISLNSIVCKTSVNTQWTATDVYNEIKDEIDYGYPVICGYDGHARIAYGYSNETQKLYVHEGYRNMDNKTRLDDLVLDLSNHHLSYFSFHFNLSHVHSYHFSNPCVNHICPCGAYIHVSHVYGYDFAPYNANRHISYCWCGDYILERHDYLLNIFDNPCRCGASL